MWYTNLGTSTSFERDRDLLVTQLNGDHTIEQIPGLHASWAANYAKTTQKESALGTRIFFEPDDPNMIPEPDPAQCVASLAPGRFAAPRQRHRGERRRRRRAPVLRPRFDGDYERMICARYRGVAEAQRGRLARERTPRRRRPTFSRRLGRLRPLQTERSVTGDFSQFVFLGDTQNQLGHNTFANLLRDRTETSPASATPRTTRRARSTRATSAPRARSGSRSTCSAARASSGSGSTRTTTPFTGDRPRFGAPAIFPEAYLFFDRLDNPARGEVTAAPPKGTVFNDQILGDRRAEGPEHRLRRPH